MNKSKPQNALRTVTIKINDRQWQRLKCAALEEKRSVESFALSTLEMGVESTLTGGSFGDTWEKELIETGYPASISELRFRHTLPSRDFP
jgi:hypothetical protein